MELRTLISLPKFKENAVSMPFLLVLIGPIPFLSFGIPSTSENFKPIHLAFLLIAMTATIAKKVWNGEIIRIDKPVLYVGGSMLILGFVSVMVHGINSQALSLLALACSIPILSVFFSNFKLEFASVAMILMLQNIALLGGLAVSLYTGAPRISPHHSLFGSYFGFKNQFVIYLTALLPILLGGSALEKRTFNKILMLAVVILDFYCVVTYRTRSCWFMAAFMLMVFAFGGVCAKGYLKEVIFKAGKICFATAGVSIMLSLIMPLPGHWNSETPYTDSFKSLVNPSQWSGRDIVWTVGVNAFKQKWGFGHGLGRTASAVESILNHDTLGVSTLLTDRIEILFNEYLQTAVELGIFGFLLAAALWVWMPASTIFHTLHVDSGVNKADIVATFFCMTTCLLIALNALVDVPFHTYATSVLFFCCLAAGRYPLATFASELKTRVSIAAFCGVGQFLVWYGLTLLFVLILQFERTPLPLLMKLESSYRLLPWDSRLTRIAVDRDISEGLFSAAKLKVNAQLKAWPNDSRTASLAAHYFEKDGNVPEATEFYRKYFFLLPRCGMQNIESAKPFLMSLPETARDAFIASMPKGKCPPILLPKFDHIRWGKAQRHLSEWKTTPLVDGNWSGRNEPYLFLNEKLEPFLDQATRNKMPDYNFFSPESMSDESIVMTGLQRSIEKFQQLFWYNREQGRIKQLTFDPAFESLHACTNPADHTVSFSQGRRQKILRIADDGNVSSLMDFRQRFSFV